MVKACARNITLAAEFQGWKSVAHGGSSMALLDEAMAHAAGHAGHRGMTASINVRFRKPVPIGEPLAITGKVRGSAATCLASKAAIYDASGTLLAEAKANSSRGVRSTQSTTIASGASVTRKNREV